MEKKNQLTVYFVGIVMVHRHSYWSKEKIWCSNCWRGDYEIIDDENGILKKFWKFAYAPDLTYNHCFMLTLPEWEH